jgi:hypothetical protein
MMERINLTEKGNSSYTMSCFGNVDASALPGPYEETPYGTN